jgi:hypothetical protein
MARHSEDFVVLSRERSQNRVQAGLKGARRSGAGVAGLVGMAVLAAAGCGGNSSSTPPATTGSSPATASSPATPVTSASPTAATATLTGSTLKTLLLPASTMPAGFKPDAQGARNTGTGVTQDSSTPVAASKVCNLLTGTSWILAAGVDSATFAQNDYLDGGHTQEIAQEIDTFSGSDATKVMSGLWQAFGHCRDFTQHYNGMTARTALVRSRPASAAYAAIKAVQTSPTFTGGTTLVAIRTGNAIVTVLYSSASKNEGAAALTLAEQIAQRVQHVQEQS